MKTLKYGLLAGLLLVGGFLATADGQVSVRRGLNTVTTNLRFTPDNTFDLGASGATRPRTLYVGTGINFAALLLSATAPTISSGFGTSPSIANNNGTSAFTINVGTGGTASSGVVGLPTATTGWNCVAQDQTTPGVNATKQTANTTTTATLTNYNTTTGVAAAWTASDILYVSCLAF